MSTSAPLHDSPEPADLVGALSQALSLGRGKLRGVVKDNFDVAGSVTTCGSARFAGNTAATVNADVVSRLLAGDVSLVGKARMHELAYGVTGVNEWSGTPLNPAANARIPGGSSSGCAVAVAAGLADFAIGTDTGGSIRLPAACCEVIGFKPTFGAISRQGVAPESSSLDCVGVIAANVATIATVLALILPGYEPAPSEPAPPIHVVSARADPDVQAAFDDAMARLGLRRPAAELPLLDEAFQAGLTIIGAEMWQAFSWLAPDFVDVGADVADRLRRASTISAGAVERAQAVRGRFGDEVDRLLGEDAFIILPTLPCRPPLLADANDAVAQLDLSRFVRPFNVSGHPAITLPFISSKGRPVAIQIVGRRGQDAELCALAATIEAQGGQQIGAVE